MIEVTSDYTEVFNKARQLAGLEPTRAVILWIHEGMALPCGCKIHTASTSHFSVYHGPDCKSEINGRPHKEIVGIPMSDKQACFVVSQEPMTVAVTNPHLGLFPYEKGH